MKLVQYLINEIKGGPCSLEPLAPSSMFSKLSFAADGNGNEVKWSEKLSQSHFSALGVIYQFIVEEIIR